jgi:hypothetical protein
VAEIRFFELARLIQAGGNVVIHTPVRCAC